MKKCDQIKNLFCYENNMNLLRIKYTLSKTKLLDFLENIFLNNKEIDSTKDIYYNNYENK